MKKRIITWCIILLCISSCSNKNNILDDEKLKEGSSSESKESSLPKDELDIAEIARQNKKELNSWTLKVLKTMKNFTKTAFELDLLKYDKVEFSTSIKINHTPNDEFSRNYISIKKKSREPETLDIDIRSYNQETRTTHKHILCQMINFPLKEDMLLTKIGTIIIDSIPDSEKLSIDQLHSCACLISVINYFLFGYFLELINNDNTLKSQNISPVDVIEILLNNKLVFEFDNKDESFFKPSRDRLLAYIREGQNFAKDNKTVSLEKIIQHLKGFIIVQEKDQLDSLKSQYEPLHNFFDTNLPEISNKNSFDDLNKRFLDIAHFSACYHRGRKFIQKLGKHISSLNEGEQDWVLSEKNYEDAYIFHYSEKNSTKILESTTLWFPTKEHEDIIEYTKDIQNYNSHFDNRFNTSIDDSNLFTCLSVFKEEKTYSLPCSSVIYYQLLKSKKSELKTIKRESVANKVSLSVMSIALKNNKLKVAEYPIPLKDSSPNKPESIIAMALLGTPNGRSSFWICHDFYQEIGQKRPINIKIESNNMYITFN